MAVKKKKRAVTGAKKSTPAKLMKARPIKKAAKKQGRAATLAGKITKKLKQGQRHRTVLEDKFWRCEDCGLTYTEDEEVHTCESEEEERF